MLCIYNHSSNDPFFNIASEEYLLKQFTDDIFMLYINTPSVIIGKHQNTFAEIDYRYAKEKGIKIIRRLSGGGAVYHDLGNLNFCFILNGKEGKLVDFKGYTKPIVAALSKLGVMAKFEGHNSLTVNGLKFSGNAEHVYKRRVMHHGTILFSSSMETLAEVLYVDTGKYNDRAIKSVRAKTANISDFMNVDMRIEEFADFLMDHIQQSFAEAERYRFSQSDIVAIEKLVTQKYTTWDWNFGYSPSYYFTRKAEINGESITVDIAVDKGLLSSLKLSGDSFLSDQWIDIEQKLVGLRHNPDELTQILEQMGLEENLSEELLKLLF